MAQVSLTLRPPPNVDFVNGFPGIAPAQDRPQAVVKGAVELRIHQNQPNGVKAKWVRIELRKVEQLPPGGADNVFYDFVGPSPINLWSSAEEYAVLRSQDFPFAIRIPESLPPSVELDNRGQISYELIATICLKGKKGFLRKAKAVVQTAKAPIIIDKHELHSTWPIYCQHEIRQTQQDGITLSIERNHTCFGPGDRIAVSVAVKSDNLNTMVLSGFEMSLKETLRLHPTNNYGAASQHKQQKFEKVVAHQSVESGATMYGGSTQMAELWVTLNPNHTTPTLTAARHMDIVYTCVVKALFRNGPVIVYELPVIISNWPRAASAQAIKQIGTAHNLSLIQAAPTGASPIAQPQATRAPVIANTLPIDRPSFDDSYKAGGNYATVGPTGMASRGAADEFGFSAGAASASGQTTSPSRSTFDIGTTPAAGSANPAPPVVGGSFGAGGGSYAVAGGSSSNTAATASRSGAGGSGSQWPSAEEEKHLYEQARKRVETTQGPHAAPQPINARVSSPSGNKASGSSSAAAAPQPAQQANPPANRQWLTAEEEKVQLYQKAQQAAQKYQDPTAYVPPAESAPEPSGGGSGSGSGSGGISNKPTGAQLYQAAMAARKNVAPSPIPSQQQAVSGGSSGSAAAAVPRYLTADQEKAALRRYEDAKRAVDMTQNADSAPPPVAYEDLYPAAPSAPAPVAAPPVQQAPPPFSMAGASGAGAQAILSEKERLRRQYEARDAAAALAARQNGNPPPFTTTSAPPPPVSVTPLSPPPNNQFASAIAEKEAMRRKFEEKDRQAALAAAAAKANAAKPPSPRPAAQLQPQNRSQPGPPPFSPAAAPLVPATALRPAPRLPQVPTAGGSGSGQRILTAAEEKAMLRAKYEAKDAAASGGGSVAPPQPPARNPVTNGANGASGLPSYDAPPPLMPRPPKEYIRETWDEDNRLKTALDGDGAGGSSN